MRDKRKINIKAKKMIVFVKVSVTVEKSWMLRMWCPLGISI